MVIHRSRYAIFACNLFQIISQDTLIQSSKKFHSPETIKQFELEEPVKQKVFAACVASV